MNDQQHPLPRKRYWKDVAKGYFLCLFAALVIFAIICALIESGLWIIPAYFLGAFVIVPLTMVGIYMFGEKIVYYFIRSAYRRHNRG